MKRKTIHAITAICMILSLVIAGGVNASASSYESCWIEIPFSVEDVSNKIPQGTTFEVEIKAAGKAPLPEMSTVPTEVNGNYTIGRITFDQPGTYSYSLSIRKTEDTDSDVHADENVYDLKVFVLARDDGSLYNSIVVYQNGTQLKNDSGVGPGEDIYMISFRNSYGNNNTNDPMSSQDNADGQTPHTGETDWALPATLAMIISCLFILMICLRRFRSRSDARKGA